MPWEFPVEMIDGSTYVVRQLLAKGESNVKLSKSDKAGVGIITMGLSLAPAKSSGYNLCTSASEACIAGCLNTSGMASFIRTIHPARIAKSRFLRKHPKEFETRLRLELTRAVARADKAGVKLAVRLNVISDVQWEKEFPGLLASFPDVQFYDYTKHPLRMQRWLDGKLPDNLHLTFSWSGTNEDKCLQILKGFGNVAVPFQIRYHGDKRQPLPARFLGFPVLDGDIDDLRFLQGKQGAIIGLRAKGKAKLDHDSGFVIAKTDPRVEWGASS
jgi:hypothetical protein